MLGGQPVIGRQQARSDGPRQPPRQMSIERRRADHITATMQVENVAVML